MEGPRQERSAMVFRVLNHPNTTIPRKCSTDSMVRILHMYPTLQPKFPLDLTYFPVHRATSTRSATDSLRVARSSAAAMSRDRRQRSEQDRIEYRIRAAINASTMLHRARGETSRSRKRALRDVRPADDPGKSNLRWRCAGKYVASKKSRESACTFVKRIFDTSSRTYRYRTKRAHPSISKSGKCSECNFRK